MATVRITGAVREKIANHIDQMQKVEINNVKTPESMQSIKVDRYDPRILARVFTEAPHLADQIPPDWLIEKEAIPVRVKLTYRDQFMSRTTNVWPAAGTHFFVPHIHRYTNIELDTQEHIDQWPELEHVIKFWMDEAEINYKWTTVKQKVLDYLDKFASINSALKAWDGLGLYLPRSIYEQLEEKVVRAKNVDDVPDMSEVTAVAAAYRMGV